MCYFKNQTLQSQIQQGRQLCPNLVVSHQSKSRRNTKQHTLRNGILAASRSPHETKQPQAFQFQPLFHTLLLFIYENYSHLYMMSNYWPTQLTCEEGLVSWREMTVSKAPTRALTLLFLLSTSLLAVSSITLLNNP